MILKLGSKGEAVKDLQRDLASLKYPLDVDGDFGPKTDAAVRAFQRDHNLKSDGIAGPLTLLALEDAAASLVPQWLSDLAARIASIFGKLPSGFEPFVLDDDTETVNGLTMPRNRCYPLRSLADGRKPTVTSGHYLSNPDRKNHNGVDLFYAWKQTDEPMKVGDGGRTAKWFIPRNTWAVAPANGIVTLAGNSKTGKRVWIQHAGGIYTGFFHMTQLAVNAGDVVRMGDPIGVVGDNPVDTDPMHLHWEVYVGDLAKYAKGTVDPERWLRGAKVLGVA